MSVVNRQIRKNEGTIVSPAPNNNKQGSYNIGVSGLSDRTQHIHKDSAGTNHIFITKDEIESLIALGIPVSSSNVYIIPTSVENFIELLEGDLVYNIWAQNLTLVDFTHYTINVISSKNIYAPSNTDLTFGDASMHWEWPTSGTDDINISFYTNVNDVAQNHDNNGGFNGSPKYRLRFKGINYPVFNYSVAGTDFKTLYENNTSTNTFSGANLDNLLTLWSGDNTLGRSSASVAIITSNTDISSSNYDALKVGDVHGNNVQISVDTTVATVGVPIHKVQFNDGTDVLARTALRTLETGVVVPALQTQIDEIDVFNVDVNSHVGIGTLPYDWDDGIQSEDLGEVGSRGVNADGALYDGVNFYIDSNNFRFKTAQPATWTETIAGLIITYTNSNTPSALGIITRVELSRVDANGNIAHNGATIPSTLDVNIIYEFWPQSCIMKGDGNGNIWNCNNTYYDGVDFKSINSTSDFCTYTKIDTSSFTIRKSTIISTAVNQTMIMTTVITPT